MAYVAKHIEVFIEKVRLEAEIEAQKVFDKYNDELQQMINKQVLKGQKLYVGMGSAVIDDSNRTLDYDYAQKFLRVVSDTQYHKENVRAGFSIEDFNNGYIKNKSK